MNIVKIKDQFSHEWKLLLANKISILGNYTEEDVHKTCFAAEKIFYCNNPMLTYNANTDIYIATTNNNNTLLGMIFVENTDKNNVFIHTFCVIYKHRHKKIGSKLFEFILDKYKHKKITLTVRPQQQQCNNCTKIQAYAFEELNKRWSKLKKLYEEHGFVIEENSTTSGLVTFSKYPSSI